MMDETAWRDSTTFSSTRMVRREMRRRVLRMGITLRNTRAAPISATAFQSNL